MLATATEISPARPAAKRIEVVLRNLDAAKTISIYYSTNEAVAVNSGVVLRPYDTIAMSKSEGYDPWQGAITGIASAAGGAALAVYERYE